MITNRAVELTNVRVKPISFKSMMKKYQTICLTLIFLLSFVSAAFSAADKSVKEALKESIYNTYGIKIYDYAESNGNTWSEYYLKQMIEVFKDLPKDFVSCTRMVFMDPGQEQFEIKYNGYNEEYGIVQVGYGTFYPPVVFLKRFMEVYKKEPTYEDCANRFKCMLVRGMTYSFIQENTDAYGRSDLMQSYQSVYAEDTKFSTKIYSIGDENFMVVAPGKNHLWVDLAFAVEQYCTNASGLKSKYPKRYQFVKENVFGGCGVDGWPNKYLTGAGETSGGDGHTGDYNEPDFGDDTDIGTGTITATDTDPGSDPSSDTGTTTGTETSTDPGTNPGTDPGSDSGNIQDLTDREDIPKVPNGDYMPVISQLNTGAEGLDSSQRNMPDGMKKAIKELVNQLPKQFTTCTVGINYTPTTSANEAFSSEGYVFVTNNSWFAPSFVDLDEATCIKRFKEILLREMTKCYLYYHASLITKWRKDFDKEMTNEEAKNDIVKSTVLYYEKPQYLDLLKTAKSDFIKSNIFSNKPITPVPDTDTNTNTNTNTNTDTSTNTNTNTNTDTGEEPYEGDLTVKVTIKNATSSTLTIGRPSDNMAVGFQIWGDYKNGSGGSGYIRLQGYFDGNHTIAAGGSVTGTVSFKEKDYGKFNGYPFCTANQVKGGVPSNAAIYKPDGSSYCCEEMLTGKFLNGAHYTITFNNGPVVP